MSRTGSRKDGESIKARGLALILLAAWPWASSQARSSRPDPSCRLIDIYQGLLGHEESLQKVAEGALNRELIESLGFKPGSTEAQLRKLLIAMTRDPEHRRLLIESILSQRRARSDALSETISKASRSGQVDEKAQVWDVINIGAGVHDQIAVNAFSRENPKLKVLTIEEGDQIGGPFAVLQDLIRLNSSNRATKPGQTPSPGTGNLNELPDGIIQVSDLTAQKFPTARELADAVTINRGLGTAELLFNRKVTTLEERGVAPNSEKWPARYRVTLGDGSVVYSENVVITTGVGKPRIPFEDPGSRALLAAEEAAAATKLDRFPGLATFETAAQWVNRSPKPFESLKGKKVAVVGTGDSSKVFLEWLLRLGPDGAYKDYVAQLGDVGDLVWVDQSDQNCRKFINNVRVRYADIAQGLKSGKIKPRDFKLDSIQKLPDGRFRLMYRIDKGSRKGQVIQGEIVDHVILATGQEKEVADLVKNLVPEEYRDASYDRDNPFETSKALETLEGRLAGSDDLRKFARRVASRKGGPESGAYLTGPAAGPLAEEEELAGVPQNPVSIFATGPRTQKVANLIAAKTTPRFAPYEAPAKREVSFQPRSNFVPAPIALRRRLVRRDPARPVPSLKSFDRIALATRLREVMQSRFKLPAIESGKLSFLFTRVEGGEIGLRVLEPTPLPAETLTAIQAEIQREPQIIERIAGYIGEGRRDASLKITFGVRGRDRNVLTPKPIEFETSRKRPDEDKTPSVAGGTGNAPAVSIYLDEFFSFNDNDEGLLRSVRTQLPGEDILPEQDVARARAQAREAITALAQDLDAGKLSIDDQAGRIVTITSALNASGLYLQKEDFIAIIDRASTLSYESGTLLLRAFERPDATDLRRVLSRLTNPAERVKLAEALLPRVELRSEAEIQSIVAALGVGPEVSDRIAERAKQYLPRTSAQPPRLLQPQAESNEPPPRLTPAQAKKAFVALITALDARSLSQEEKTAKIVEFASRLEASGLNLPKNDLFILLDRARRIPFETALSLLDRQREVSPATLAQTLSKLAAPDDRARIAERLLPRIEFRDEEDIRIVVNVLGIDAREREKLAERARQYLPNAQRRPPGPAQPPAPQSAPASPASPISPEVTALLDSLEGKSDRQRSQEIARFVGTRNRYTPSEASALLFASGNDSQALALILKPLTERSDFIPYDASFKRVLEILRRSSTFTDEDLLGYLRSTSLTPDQARELAPLFSNRRNAKTLIDQVSTPVYRFLARLQEQGKKPSNREILEFLRKEKPVLGESEAAFLESLAGAPDTVPSRDNASPSVRELILNRSRGLSARTFRNLTSYDDGTGPVIDARLVDRYLDRLRTDNGRDVLALIEEYTGEATRKRIVDRLVGSYRLPPETERSLAAKGRPPGGVRKEIFEFAARKSLEKLSRGDSPDYRSELIEAVQKLARGKRALSRREAEVLTELLPEKVRFEPTGETLAPRLSDILDKTDSLSLALLSRGAKSEFSDADRDRFLANNVSKAVVSESDIPEALALAKSPETRARLEVALRDPVQRLLARSELEGRKAGNQDIERVVVNLPAPMSESQARRLLSRIDLSESDAYGVIASILGKTQDLSSELYLQGIGSVASKAARKSLINRTLDLFRPRSPEDIARLEELIDADDQDLRKLIRYKLRPKVTRDRFKARTAAPPGRADQVGQEVSDLLEGIRGLPLSTRLPFIADRARAGGRFNAAEAEALLGEIKPTMPNSVRTVSLVLANTMDAAPEAVLSTFKRFRQSLPPGEIGDRNLIALFGTIAILPGEIDAAVSVISDPSLAQGFRAELSSPIVQNFSMARRGVGGLGINNSAIDATVAQLGRQLKPREALILLDSITPKATDTEKTVRSVLSKSEGISASDYRSAIQSLGFRLEELNQLVKDTSQAVKVETEYDVTVVSSLVVTDREAIARKLRERLPQAVRAN